MKIRILKEDAFLTGYIVFFHKKRVAGCILSTHRTGSSICCM